MFDLFGKNWGFKYVLNNFFIWIGPADSVAKLLETWLFLRGLAD